MANFTIDATVVLKMLHLAEDGSHIPLSQVERFIDRAIATIENELGVTLGEMTGDSESKTIDVDKKYEPVIVALAAIYCICYMTGGAAVGLSYSIGGVTVSASANAPPISVLDGIVHRELEKLGEIAFIVAEDTT